MIIVCSRNFPLTILTNYRRPIAKRRREPIHPIPLLIGDHEAADHEHAANRHADLQEMPTINPSHLFPGHEALPPTLPRQEAHNMNTRTRIHTITTQSPGATTIIPRLIQLLRHYLQTRQMRPARFLWYLANNLCTLSEVFAAIKWAWTTVAMDHHSMTRADIAQLNVN